MTLRRHPQVLLLLLAAVLMSATLVAPSVPLKRASYRYVLVFDISQSMNTADVGSEAAPLVRLEFAKQRALEALKGLPCGSEVGIALFTGHRAFLMLTPIELCANFQELSTMLASIDWRMTWEERSEVAKGVFRSLELLRALSATTRLVFLTDGHEAPPLNPDVKPGFSGEVGAVRGLLIGVGGALPVPIPKFDAEGKIASPARMTVRLNGVLVQDDVALPKTTTASPLKNITPEKGPIYIQHHGNPVYYRNVWLVKK